MGKIGLQPEKEMEKFITKVNTASVATRYPEDLAKLQAVYTAEITVDMLGMSQEVLQWVK